MALIADPPCRGWTDAMTAFRNTLSLLEFSRKPRVPVVLQNEAAECGVACLAMIGGFHGRMTTLHGLRQQAGLTLRGATLSQLIQVAGSMGLAARPLRLELEHLGQLKLPCILHWQQSHFVVLTKVERGYIRLIDPAKGECRVPMRDVDQSFTGVALELTPTADFKVQAPEARFGILQLWSGITGFWSAGAQVLGLSLALLLLSLLAPYYAQLVVDEAVSSHNKGLLVTLAIGFGLLTVFQSGLGALRSMLVLVLGNQISIQVGSSLFAHLLRLPTDYFEKRHVGDIVSRFVSLERIREQVTSAAIEAVIDGLLVIVTVALMWLYSPLLVAVVIGAVLLYFLLKYLTFSTLSRATEEQIAATARKDTTLIESMRSIAGIKLFQRGPQRLAIWQNYFAESLNAGFRAGRITVGLAFANQLIFGLEKIIVLYLAATLLMAGEMSLGALMAFLAYKTQFTDRASALVDKWQLLRLTRIHLDRVADIVLTETEAEVFGESLASPGTACSVKFDDVRFRYGSSGPWVLDGAHLDIQPGECVAIVGGSGQGKTTLLKLLLGLLKPASGSITVDGRDLWSSGGAARGRIAAILQDESPLSGTIAENIAFFDESINMEMVMRSSMAAGLHSDIMRMPMNYQSLVGDMGSALSGGQRQRLLVARALYKAPGVIVMDEATSNLDVMTERLVSSSIKQLAITRILVAHRPETILSADRVVALENGKLVELDRDKVDELFARVTRT